MEENTERREDFFIGIALIAAFVIVGVAMPLMFRNIPVMLLGTLFIFFGIAGMGIELDKIFGKVGYTEMFLGLGFVLLGIAIVILFPNVVTKILCILLLLVGVFGFIVGLAKRLSQKKEQTFVKEKIPKAEKKKFFALVMSVIVGITGFIANICTILAFFIS